MTAHSNSIILPAVSRNVTWLLVLLNVIAAGALLAARGHRAANEPIPELTDVERAAGLDRCVPSLILKDVSLDESLRRLARVSGTRIVMSANLPTLPQHMFAGSNITLSNLDEWKRLIRLRVHDVTVAAVLNAIMTQCNDAFRVPIAFAARSDGSIYVGGEEEMPRLMRAYELGAVPRAIGPEQRHWLYASEYASPQEELAWLPFAQMGMDRRFEVSGARTECFGTTLIVVASVRWQRYVQQMVRELRSIKRPWPAGSRDGIRGPVLTELRR